jgi:hypothetical protein
MCTADRPTKLGSARRVLLALGLAVCASAVLLGWYLYAARGRNAAVPRTEPLSIPSEPGLCLDELPEGRLARALGLCLPGPPIREVSGRLHVIRLWSLRSGSPCPQRDSANRMLEALLDHRAARKESPSGPPFLVSTQHGVRFMEMNRDTPSTYQAVRESHVGQTLSVLAEVGVPLTAEVWTPDGPATLQAVLDDTVANFNLEQELDWVTVSLALYLPDRAGWCNKYGARHTHADIARKLLERPLGKGSSCAGIHTLYALTVLLRADEQRGFLPGPTREEVERYLCAARDKLALCQRATGAWDRNWAEERPTTEGPSGTFSAQSDVETVLVTGHHLEWMALAPNRLRVPRSQLVRAAEFVCLETSRQTPQTVWGNLCPYTHGLRAIRLLLGGSDPTPEQPPD